MKEDPKVAIVGCGALGSYYGALLRRAGLETWFLLRSDYEVVRQRGLRVESPNGDFLVHPNCALAPGEIGLVDLVLIGLKTTANDQFHSLLPPLVGADTVVVTLQNGLGNEKALARIIPPAQIMGGLCFVCLNRVQPGLIRHLAHGNIVLGEYERRPEPRTHVLADLFRRGGVPCKVTEHLARAHWEKLVWNIPFNGLGVAAAAGYDAVFEGQLPGGQTLAECATTDRLLKDGRWTELIRALMREVISAARAMEFPIEFDLARRMIDKTRTMGPYKPSTVLDFERGLPLELESLFLEPLRCARQHGLETPRLAALAAVLTQLDSSHHRRSPGCDERLDSSKESD